MVSHMTKVKVIHLSNPFGLELCTGYLMTQKKLNAKGIQDDLIIHLLSLIVHF